MPAPSVLTKEQWPPDYVSVLAWRRAQLARFELDPDLVRHANAYYARHPIEFICHWLDTYDPRNAFIGKPVWMPFILFERQADLVEFVVQCLKDEQNGLTEKCRDMGATWDCCGVSVWLWKYWPGAAIGWGSRKAELVDRIGDPKSIFEKLRMLITRMPRIFWPAGLNPDDHLLFMRILNPENGATITGEIGDDIGRGGRTLIYFKDESAHYVHPESIQAALDDNTRVQIDISSVNGPNNVFHRKREAGMEWTPGCQIPKGTTRIFVLDWRDHPEKTQEWYDERKRKATIEGMLHKFAQEIERNYFAAIQGVIIAADWVKSARDAHLVLGIPDTGGWAAGLDIADEGMDRNALVTRKGIVLKSAEEWAVRDTAVTARRAASTIRGLAPIECQYDCCGLGAGVKAEVNNLKDEDALPKGVTFVPWNAGDSVLNPKGRVNRNENGTDDKDSPTNEDFYKNLKAQGWWELRSRFYRTHMAVTHGGKYDPKLNRVICKTKEFSASFDPDDLISIDSKIALLHQVEKELSQATIGYGARLKLVVNKTPDGTKSPNLADAIVEAFWPVCVVKPKTRTSTVTGLI